VIGVCIEINASEGKWMEVGGEMIGRRMVSFVTILEPKKDQCGKNLV
jgi:hypothetical protein